MQPTAPVPRNEPENVDAAAASEDENVLGAGGQRSRKERSQLIREAAESEVNTFVSSLVSDVQDGGKLKSSLLEHAGIQKPLPSQSRLVLHFDWSKEAEASSTFTRSHNIFERIPGICRVRATMMKSVLDLMLGDKAEAAASMDAWFVRV